MLQREKTGNLVTTGMVHGKIYMGRNDGLCICLFCFLTSSSATRIEPRTCSPAEKMAQRLTRWSYESDIWEIMKPTKQREAEKNITANVAMLIIRKMKRTGVRLLFWCPFHYNYGYFRIKDHVRNGPYCVHNSYYHYWRSLPFSSLTEWRETEEGREGSVEEEREGERLRVRGMES